MANIETLLLLGMAKGIDPTRPLSVSGFIRPEDRIMWGDVQAAIASLEPHYRAALVIKAAPMLVEATELEALLRRITGVILRVRAGISPSAIAANTRRRIGNWESDLKVTPQQQARASKMADVVLSEYVDDRVCRECYGRGTVQVYIPERGVVKQNCEHCVGRGYTYWSDKRRAKACGLRQVAKDWKATHEHAYLTALQFCRGQYLTANAMFKHSLFGNDTEREGVAA